mmetsp:Transcript_7578/g.11240  ORF Transcript_7578/g.11240 Transcript_7578/m.11240 type:complete len:101 (-) Transcript_7578:241-543(-)
MYMFLGFNGSLELSTNPFSGEEKPPIMVPKTIIPNNGITAFQRNNWIRQSNRHNPRKFKEFLKTKGLTFLFCEHIIYIPYAIMITQPTKKKKKATHHGAM